MKQVSAIVRTTCLERVVHALEQIGVRRVTILKAKGLGEEVRLNAPYAVHDQIEMIVPDDLVDRVVDVVVENSHTGLAGDGIITVRSLDYAVEIRTKEKLR
jgi:nitrogen regulatory protein P-II 1